MNEVCDKIKTINKSSHKEKKKQKKRKEKLLNSKIRIEENNYY